MNEQSVPENEAGYTNNSVNGTLSTELRTSCFSSIRSIKGRQRFIIGLSPFRGLAKIHFISLDIGQRELESTRA